MAQEKVERQDEQLPMRVIHASGDRFEWVEQWVGWRVDFGDVRKMEWVVRLWGWIGLLLMGLRNEQIGWLR